MSVTDGAVVRAIVIIVTSLSVITAEQMATYYTKPLEIGFYLGTLVILPAIPLFEFFGDAICRDQAYPEKQVNL